MRCVATLLAVVGCLLPLPVLAREPSTRTNVVNAADREHAARDAENAAWVTPPDRAFLRAMDDAANTRIALEDWVQAERDVRWLLLHGRGAAQAHTLGAHWESRGAWSTARAWYRTVIVGFAERPGAAGVRFWASAGEGRACEAVGDRRGAESAWQRAVDVGARLFPEVTTGPVTTTPEGDQAMRASYAEALLHTITPAWRVAVHRLHRGEPAHRNRAWIAWVASRLVVRLPTVVAETRSVEEALFRVEALQVSGWTPVAVAMRSLLQADGIVTVLREGPPRTFQRREYVEPPDDWNHLPGCRCGRC